MPTGDSDHGDKSDSSAFCLARAREQLRCAQAEPLVSRKRVHIVAANQWLRLAETARRVERRARRVDHATAASESLKSD